LQIDPTPQCHPAAGAKPRLTNRQNHQKRDDPYRVEHRGLVEQGVVIDPRNQKHTRDPHGNPTGVLKEPSAMGFVTTLIPPITLEQMRQGILYSQQVLHSEGMTAVKDPDYKDGKGIDHITYKASLPADVDATKCSVQATLYYQSMPPYYLAQRFAEAPSGEATRRLYYLTSNLNLKGTTEANVSIQLNGNANVSIDRPANPVKDWKLKIVSASAVVATKR